MRSIYFGKMFAYLKIHNNQESKRMKKKDINEPQSHLVVYVRVYVCYTLSIFFLPFDKHHSSNPQAKCEEHNNDTHNNNKKMKKNLPPSWSAVENAGENETQRLKRKRKQNTMPKLEKMLLSLALLFLLLFFFILFIF